MVQNGEVTEMPAPEHHDTYGGHDAVWLMTSCGQADHPKWWSCSVCAERPKGGS